MAWRGQDKRLLDVFSNGRVCQATTIKEDEEERDNDDNKHNKDNNNLQPLTNDDLTIVGERTRRLLDSV